MNFNSDMLIGLLFIGCCALIALKLIWNIGIPVLKIIIAALLIYFAILWFGTYKNRIVIQKTEEPTTISIQHEQQ